MKRGEGAEEGKGEERDKEIKWQLIKKKISDNEYNLLALLEYKHISKPLIKAPVLMQVFSKWAVCFCFAAVIICWGNLSSQC